LFGYHDDTLKKLTSKPIKVMKLKLWRPNGHKLI